MLLYICALLNDGTKLHKVHFTRSSLNRFPKPVRRALGNYSDWIQWEKD